MSLQFPSDNLPTPELTPNGDVRLVYKNEQGAECVSLKRDHRNLSNIDTLGYFGNIWVRSHTLVKAGDSNGEGHTHHFDHVTLVMSGSVKVEVVGHEPKVFTAPNFIVIDKDKKHKFTALEDNTVYFCVFALRDINGDVTNIYSGDNTPYSTVEKTITSVEEIEELRKKTIIE